MITTKSNIKKIYKNDGITLIALVLTIIILVTLAGVSIATLTGSNGILAQAQSSKQITVDSAEQEQRKLSQIEANTHFENYDYIDTEGNTVKIPAGFAVSNIKGENLVSKGLVIIGTTGNEYVWIPCTEATYQRDTTWQIENDPEDNPTLATKDELTLTGLTPSEEEIGNGITTDILNEIVEQVKNEIASIRKNGGYYIGRYEVGNENEKTVIKQNQEPYAGKLWSEAYKEAKNIDVGNGGVSYLCSSYAWDTAIKFIQTHSEIADYATSRDNFIGNWKDKEIRDKNGNVIKAINTAARINTGLTTSLANIYDMGGNVVEFTTELNPDTSEAVITRGGNYGGRRPAGYRWDINSGYTTDRYGMRTTLFLK